MPSVRPKLEKLTTPVTANFPSAITSSAVTSPLSATSFHFKVEPDSIKTPISPPMAYMDFLTKAKALGSPSTPPALSSGEVTPDSLPESSASSELSDCSCKSGRPSPKSLLSRKPMTPATAPFVPPSPFPTSAPMSAPLSGPASFPSLKLPPSPAISCLDSPLTPNTAMSPFSAHSLHSVFDWEAALKARYAEQKKQKSNRTSVRHIREVVTRTVTYTPRMEPAPRGKRRKVE
ncbi:hypothetical protein S40285_00743 [Stachybotrys chlorohalonatus IBT 40285]|uniref:Uncharacterized protein n=1 Tax=Stachybotrys chlorohalonatus (strain IBT 40285) TaxID=1283841 RepID=A0A084QR71_STAC4|nr:hypothetical protein S40285_00743 [Stachybotrys chlorohalonata IBT 40285]